MYTVLPHDARRYYKDRSELYAKENKFDACRRHDCSACCMDNVDIVVNSFDLIGMALLTEHRPDNILDTVTPKLDISGRPTIKLVLDMPCAYLKDKLCKLHKNEYGYSGKPIGCGLFPENIHAIKTVLDRSETEQMMARKPHIFMANKAFPCLAEDFEIGHERLIALLQLELLNKCEEQASNIYLFGHPGQPDCSELLQAKDPEKEFHSMYGKKSTFYKNISTKIAALSTRQGLEELFSYLQITKLL